MKKKQMIGIVVAGVVFIAVCVTGILSNVLTNKVLEANKSSSSSFLNSFMSEMKEDIELPTEDFIGVIDVVGTIQASSSSSSGFSSTAGQYDHDL